MPDYELSKEQELFVREAENQGLEVDYTYSGRFMYGRKCPSVRVDNVHSFQTNAKGAQWDQMGLGFVIYCPY